MDNQKKFLVSSSINDFAPLFLGLEYLFKGLKGVGVDGLEIVIGIKSRWSVKYLKYLCEKYNLPVVTIHQPIWSGLNIYFDDHFVNLARELSVKHVVFHPLTGISLQHEKMKKYFQKMAEAKKEYGVEVMLENLPTKYELKILNYLVPPDKKLSNMLELLEIAEEYDFLLNFDISHLQSVSPHREDWFSRILPKIGNIHLSSFDKYSSHLPLNTGDFKTKEFISYLYDKNYNGFITLEVYYPSLFNLFGYNFTSIKNSLDVIKAVYPG